MNWSMRWPLQTFLRRESRGPAPRARAPALLNGLHGQQEQLEHREARRPWFGTDTALRSDAGPVRSSNEDCLLASTERLPGRAGERCQLVALADGMGGHEAGEVASRLAVETAVDLHRQGAGAAPQRRLQQALQAAHTVVYQRACAQPGLAGMGTTLLLLALTDDGAHAAWVGDSRLYHWRAGVLRQLSRDDTLLQDLLDSGQLQPGQARDYPERGVLSQALGTQPVLSRGAHLIGPIGMAVGDRFLLCSDGLHDVLPDALIASALGAGPAANTAEALLRLACAHGADDNISVAVVAITALDEAPRRARTTVAPAAAHTLANPSADSA